MVRCTASGSNGMDDGRNNCHRECKFNEVAESYERESIDRPKQAKTTIQPGQPHKKVKG